MLQRPAELDVSQVPAERSSAVYIKDVILQIASCSLSLFIIGFIKRLLLFTTFNVLRDDECCIANEDVILEEGRGSGASMKTFDDIGV